jgi:hypothetical protein
VQDSGHGGSQPAHAGAPTATGESAEPAEADAASKNHNRQGKERRVRTVTEIELETHKLRCSGCSMAYLKGQLLPLQPLDLEEKSEAHIYCFN